LYRDKGKLQQAAQLLRRAHALRVASLGELHSSTVRLQQLLDQIAMLESSTSLTMP
jgi:hypothetical protein